MEVLEQTGTALVRGKGGWVPGVTGDVSWQSLFAELAGGKGGWVADVDREGSRGSVVVVGGIDVDEVDIPNNAKCSNGFSSSWVR